MSYIIIPPWRDVVLFTEKIFLNILVSGCQIVCSLYMVNMVSTQPVSVNRDGILKRNQYTMIVVIRERRKYIEFWHIFKRESKLIPWFLKAALRTRSRYWDLKELKVVSVNAFTSPFMQGWGDECSIEFGLFEDNYSCTSENWLRSSNNGIWKGSLKILRTDKEKTVMILDNGTVGFTRTQSA